MIARNACSDIVAHEILYVGQGAIGKNENEEFCCCQPEIFLRAQKVAAKCCNG